MPIFMKLGDVQGEAADAADADDNDWILCESFAAVILCTAQPTAIVPEQSRGETTFVEVNLVRRLDKWSVKLQENCANGTCFDEIEIHVGAQVGSSPTAYFRYKLKNVIIGGYVFFYAAATGDPATEEITMNCTGVECMYVQSPY